ncbi:MAG: hypothetical protein EAZ57_04835 [Cytophagales bacterium]|nr:MAG: hypothetical protein EAZ67_01045 [Cytophagales bacterium]TAF61119.1 MAG: hypothetical protein EAZ57_04835 [Cytophagales bacterium]
MKLAKVFWLISLFMFLALILVNHVNAPELMVLPFRDAFFSDSITRDTFFYASLGIFIFTNLVFMIVGRIYPLVFSFLPLPQKNVWNTNPRTRALLFEQLNDWTKGIAFVFNLLIMTIVGMVIDFNDVYMHYQLHWALIVEVILLMAWFFMYYVTFNKISSAQELIAVQS